MLKARFTWILFFISASIIFFSCNKDAGSKEVEPYVASPGKLIDMTGADWAIVEPGVKGKKDYWYTEFSQEDNFAVKAAVSLKAAEESNKSVSYYMLLNVARHTNKVNSISIYSLDSTYKLGKDEAYTLMLHYYNDGLKTLPDVTIAIGSYELPDGTVVSTSSDEIVRKLNSGYETGQLNIYYISSKGNFSIVINKNAVGDSYVFSFNAFTN